MTADNGDIEELLDELDELQGTGLYETAIDTACKALTIAGDGQCTPDDAARLVKALQEV